LTQGRLVLSCNCKGWSTSVKRADENGNRRCVHTVDVHNHIDWLLMVREDSWLNQYRHAITKDIHREICDILSYHDIPKIANDPRGKISAVTVPKRVCCPFCDAEFDIDTPNTIADCPNGCGKFRC
jgi:hypothetical protein